MKATEVGQITKLEHTKRVSKVQTTFCNRGLGTIPFTVTPFKNHTPFCSTLPTSQQHVQWAVVFDTQQRVAVVVCSTSTLEFNFCIYALQTPRNHSGQGLYRQADVLQVFHQCLLTLTLSAVQCMVMNSLETKAMTLSKQDIFKTSFWFASEVLTAEE